MALVDGTAHALRTELTSLVTFCAEKSMGIFIGKNHSACMNSVLFSSAFSKVESNCTPPRPKDYEVKMFHPRMG
jgi:hypothetical protein